MGWAGKRPKTELKWDMSMRADADGHFEVGRRGQTERQKKEAVSCPLAPISRMDYVFSASCATGIHK